MAASRHGLTALLLSCTVLCALALPPVAVSVASRQTPVQPTPAQLLPNGSFSDGTLHPWSAAGSPAPIVLAGAGDHTPNAALVGRLNGDRASVSTLSVAVGVPAGATTLAIRFTARRRCMAARPRSKLTVSLTFASASPISSSAPLTSTHTLASHHLVPPRLAQTRQLGCALDSTWRVISITTPLSPAIGGTTVMTFTVRATLAASETAALLLDNAEIIATVPTLHPTRTASITPTTTATLITPTMTATLTPTETLTPTFTSGPSPTPTFIPDLCATAAISTLYQSAQQTVIAAYTPTRVPATATETPNAQEAARQTVVAAYTETSTPTHQLNNHKSNLPTPIPPRKDTPGPTPGFTPTPGPSATISPSCHTVVKGLSSTFLTQNGDAAPIQIAGATDLASLQAVGARTVRVDFHLVRDSAWTTAEFAAYDSALAPLCSSNVDIEGLLGAAVVSPVTNPNSWVANSMEHDGGSGDNAFIHLYAQRALDIVAHYHACIHTWELWNEPNVSSTYLYPSNFAALLAETYSLVKNTYPDVTIVSGGLFSSDSGGHSSPRNAGADYLRQTYAMGLSITHSWDAVRAQFGGANPLDAVGQHLYLDQSGLVVSQHIIEAYRWVHDAYAAFGDGAKPIYVTEAAWSTPSVSPDTQALNLDILYTMSQSPLVPYVARVYWFLLRDDAAANLGYGLETTDGTPKPAYARYLAY